MGKLCCFGTKKISRLQKIDATQFFWRTTQQQEIDLVEEADSHLSAFEIKWNLKEKGKFPQTFTANYLDAELDSISTANLEEYLTDVSQ